MNVRPLWWILFGLTCFIVTSGFVKERVLRSESAGAFHGALPVLGRVKTFQLIDSQGKPFALDRLRGKIWVADFIFTRCGGQCPIMTRHMEKIQSLLPTEAPVELVSISVDPEFDTPNVLSDYASTTSARSGRWHFLTGSAEAIAALMRDSFHLPGVTASSNATEMLFHSDRFVLVDPAFQIRGYYTGTDPDSVAQLVKDMGRL